MRGLVWEFGPPLRISQISLGGRYRRPLQGPLTDPLPDLGGVLLHCLARQQRFQGLNRQKTPTSPALSPRPCCTNPTLTQSKRALVHTSPSLVTPPSAPTPAGSPNRSSKQTELHSGGVSATMTFVPFERQRGGAVLVS